jgi:uncharacterized protein
MGKVNFEEYPCFTYNEMRCQKLRQAIKDKWLIWGFFIAHLLLFFTFQDKTIFWYIFSASMLVLISFSISKESIENNEPIWRFLILGAISGAILFSFFWIGDLLINVFHLRLNTQVSALYKWYAPKEIWHYYSLMLILAPGEEIFWRGFIQKRLLTYVGRWTSVPVTAILYTSVHLYSDHWMLPFSALFAGIVWSWLYAWKRSLPLVIVSHLIFDWFLFILFSLR